MANEGIFITKNGVLLPAVTEIPANNWAAYQADLVLPLIQNTNHEFSAFEGFKYRGFIDSDTTCGFIPNGHTNYTPQFITGTGTLNTSTGEIKPSSLPASFEKANTIFLLGSTLKVQQFAHDDQVSMRIASIDGLSRILLNLDTGQLDFYKANVSEDSTTTAVTEPSTVTIEVTDSAITFTQESDSVELYSLPRTFTAKVLSGGIGVLASSGTETGDALPFSDTDTLQAADITGNGTMSIESSFGQSTTYTVKLGEELTANDDIVPLTMVAGQSSSHNVTDDYSDGVGSKVYSLDGALPSGVVLTSGGVIIGTPVTDGLSEVKVTVTDEYGTAINIEYQITVIQSANAAYNPPSGIQDTAYSYHPNIPNVSSVVLTMGSLPTGLTLDEATGNISGTPTIAATYAFAVTVTTPASAEGDEIECTIVIYGSTSAEVFKNQDSAGIITNGGSLNVAQSDNIVISMSGGSGQFQYSITGGNTINSDGVVELFETGQATVTVVDIVTGEVYRVTLNIAGQGDICAMAVETEDDTTNSSAPCTDILTDCQTPVTVSFNALQILKGLEPTEVVYREYPNFTAMEAATVQNNGKPFAMFRSTAVNGYAVADNAKDGKPFLVEMAVSSSVANSTADIAIGVAKQFAPPELTSLNFGLVFTTISSQRKVEIRKDNVYQAGSRFDIAEGQQVGLAIFADSVLLYVDGLLVYQLSSNTFACTGLDLVFFSEASNIIMGGQVGNLLYSITTSGSADDVGVIDAQTGLYTPSLNNVGLVKIAATNTANDQVIYQSSIRVIRGAVKTSLERSMIEGIPIDIWIADADRKDELPMRLDRQGRPDKNQFTNPQHLGTLQGSGKIDTTPTRQEFRNDRGATSSSLVFDKVTVSGGFLAVRNIPLVKKLVPYMKEFNSHGVRSLKQYSSGCHKRMRVIMIWQTADCDDVPVFDAIEIGNGLSYTMFNIEVGQGVQTNIPITIEGFPDKNSVLFEYSQFDKAFQRIGS